MKLRITITGPKVHDVGYRPFLAEMAMRISPKGFDVYNDEEEGRQAVIALIEGDERRIRRFIEVVKTQRPPLARVHEIKAEDYADDVMPAWQTATTTLLTQFNKAVPILQRMSDDLNEIKGDLKAVKENTDALSPTRQMQEDIRAIKDRLGMV